MPSRGLARTKKGLSVVFEKEAGAEGLWRPRCRCLPAQTARFTALQRRRRETDQLHSLMPAGAASSKSGLEQGVGRGLGSHTQGNAARSDKPTLPTLLIGWKCLEKILPIVLGLCRSHR
jgi:hypothetical protein